MNVQQLEQIGTEVFGNARFGSRLAEAIGMSPATISNFRSGKLPISKKAEQRIVTFYERVKGNRSASPVVAQANGETSEVSFSDNTLRGEASFKLRLIAQDAASGKMVKVTEVNPALFFPNYVPNAVAPVASNDGDIEGPKMAQVEANDNSLSDDEILSRIATRIRVMDRIAQGVIAGDVPSMIVYGAPGVGKSHTIMEALKDAVVDDKNFHYDVIKGAVRAPGLYKALFRARKGGVVVLDDSDSIFDDEDALNLLKAALDSSDERLISWRKQSPWLGELDDESGEDASNFVFEGGVIFITNINMKKRVAKGHRMAPHYEALISRSHYIDLTMDSTRARMLRVRQVFVNAGMARGLGLAQEEAEDIVQFMNTNRDRLLEVSLRMVKMITQVYKSDPQDWKEIIEVTKMS